MPVRFLSLALVLTVIAPAATIVDDEIADAVRRLESLSSRESPWPRIDTLLRAADLLVTANPAKSKAFRERAERLQQAQTTPRPQPLMSKRAGLEKALETNAGRQNVEREAELFLSALEHAAESPEDYSWFAELRRRHDIVKGGDNASVRAREALHDLAELVRTDLTLEFTDLAGRPVKLESYRGHIVVLSLWATWCGPCVAEVPEFQKFRAAQPENVIFAAITDEPAEVVRAFASEHRLNYTILLDPRRTSFERFGVETRPALRVLDQTGRLRVRSRSAGQRELERWVRAATP